MPFTRFRLDGRVALISGAGSGIGAATARALASAGALVQVTDIDLAAAARVTREIAAAGGRAEAHQLDVTDERGVARTINAVADLRGRLDILVNNAGMGARTPSEELSTETWEKVIGLNMTGAFRCTREAGRHMLKSGKGSIVNVASIMGLVGGGLYPNPAYQATKGALVNWTRAVALEWAARGVRVNAVAPSFARTALTTKLLSDPEMEKAILANTPMGRLVEPDEVAHAILFLVSDAASAITGVTLPVDGGWTAR
ncbi:MAG: SDR family oxidoreductase [Alphaproteobacteria bacterium]|nr:SDR family oxidoreductase [Alphaproteobacteria bacterium]